MRNSPQRPTPLEVATDVQRRSLYAMFIQIAIQLDHSRPSIFAPQRSKQRRATGAGGNAVVDHFRWRMANHFSGSERVILQFNTVQTPRFPWAFAIMLPFTICSGCSFMPSTPVSTTRSSVCKHSACPSPGRPTIKLGTHLQPALTCQLGCTLITGKIMAAVDAMQCFVVGGL